MNSLVILKTCRGFLFGFVFVQSLRDPQAGKLFSRKKEGKKISDAGVNLN